MEYICIFPLYISYTFTMQQGPEHLLELIYAQQNQQLQEIKPKLSGYCKYFFNYKRNLTLVYDGNTVYVVHKDIQKVIQLPKPFVITDLVYNFQKNVLLFCTVEGHLFVYFPSVKHLIPIRKDYKRVLVMDWVYGSPQAAHLFVAEDGGVHFYRFDEDRKIFKQTKHVSGKYHCFLYQPVGDILVGFPYGDCQTPFLFNFEPVRSKYWFKAGELEFKFDKDEVMIDRIKKTKSFGLESSRTCKQIFCKKQSNQDYFIDCLRICNCTYICYYMASEGKLKLVPVDEHGLRKPVTIKLPSDSLPLFNIVDNMLAVHLKNEKITFIYDIGASTFQTLVSPYPLPHNDKSIPPSTIYNSEFLGRRVLLPSGQICKWKINLRVIYHFLKNQLSIFQFFNNRSNSKMQIIRWLRDNLFTIKPINLSRIWKHIFIKSQRGAHDQSDMVTIVELYSNLFYTLSIDPLVSKEGLTNVLIECLRQCNQFHVKIPDQLEYLTAELLLNTKKYQILTFLSHHNMIKSDGRIHRLIFNQYQKTGEELLLTLSIDMASQGRDPKQMLRLLLITQRLKQAKRFLRANSDKFEVLQMIDSAKEMKNLQKRREFVKFVRFFIVQKFPSINSLYLDEAENKLFE